jgi:hypothetical protein
MGQPLHASDSIDLHYGGLHGMLVFAEPIGVSSGYTRGGDPPASTGPGCPESVPSTLSAIFSEARNVPDALRKREIYVVPGTGVEPARAAPTARSQGVTSAPWPSRQPRHCTARVVGQAEESPPSDREVRFCANVRRPAMSALRYTLILELILGASMVLMTAAVAGSTPISLFSTAPTATLSSAVLND